MPSFTKIVAFSLLSAMALSAPVRNESSRSYNRNQAVHTVGGSPPPKEHNGYEHSAGNYNHESHSYAKGTHTEAQHHPEHTGTIASMDKRDHERYAKPTSTYSRNNYSHSTYTKREYSRTESERPRSTSTSTSTARPRYGREGEEYYRQSSESTRAPRAT